MSSNVGVVDVPMRRPSVGCLGKALGLRTMTYETGPRPSGGGGAQRSLTRSSMNSAVRSDGGEGAAYIFPLLPGRAKIRASAVLTASDGAGGEFLGNYVAIDGNTVVFTGVRKNRAAYVFVEPPTGWADMIQTAKLSVGGFDSPIPVAVSNGAIVAGRISRKNSAFVAYVEPAKGWANNSSPSDWGTSPEPDESFGGALAWDGSTLAVGDEVGDGQQGAVFIFTKP